MDLNSSPSPLAVYILHQILCEKLFFERFGKVGHQVTCLNKIFPPNPPAMVSDPGEVNNNLPLTPLRMETSIFHTTSSLPTKPFGELIKKVRAVDPLTPAYLSPLMVYPFQVAEEEVT